MSVRDRNIVVVGATGTIGNAVVEALVDDQARVLAVGRSASRLATTNPQAVGQLAVDLASPASASAIKAEARRILGPAVDGLVIASGAHGPIGPTRQLARKDLRHYLDEHLAAMVELIAALAPALDAAVAPSVVAFSGGGATSARPRYTPYALAKVATVRLVENLAAEELGWKVNAIAPGFVASRIHDSTIAAGFERSGEDPDDLVRRLGAADDPGRVAALVHFLLGPESEGISGRLISSQWDPWDAPEWQRTIRESQCLGRLRRIDGQQFGAQNNVE